MDIPKADLLGRIPMFSGLEAAALHALAQRAAPRAYEQGRELFHEGDPCEGVYVIASGRVRIFKTSPSGRQLTLAVESAPATVAEVPLFDGGPYPASVKTIEPVVALFIHKRDFQAVCLQHPHVALQALAVFGRRLRMLLALIESVTFGSIRQRLARTLLEQADLARSDTFALPWTHQELALNFGTAREVISRNLNRFQADGLIEVSHRQITLVDREELAREAQAEL
jgi:CRP/FNR family transcriptional regulator